MPGYERFDEAPGVTRCVPTDQTRQRLANDPNVSNFCKVPEDIQAYRASWRWLFWFDEPFRLLLGAIAKLADTSFQLLGDLLINLMVAGILIWFAWHILKNFGTPLLPFGDVSPQAIVKPFAIIMFKGIIAFLIIKSGGRVIYDFIITPTIKLAVGITQLFGAHQTLPMNIGSQIEQALGGPSGDSFRAMTETIMTFLSNLFVNIMDIIVIGMIYIRFAFQKGTINAYITQLCFIPTFGELATGLALVFVGGMLMLQIPFRLMTAMLRLAFMVVFMPVAVVSWVFPWPKSVPLSEITRKMVEILVHVVATMIFSAITVFVIAQFLDQVLRLNNLMYANAAEMYEKMAMIDGSSGQSASALINFFLFIGVLVFVWLLAGRVQILGSIFGVAGDLGKMTAARTWDMVPSAANNDFAEDFSGVAPRYTLKDSTLNEGMHDLSRKFFASAVYGSVSPIRFINANLPGWRRLELDKTMKDRGKDAESRLFEGVKDKDGNLVRTAAFLYPIALLEHSLMRGIGRMNKYNPLRKYVRGPAILMQKSINRQARNYRNLRRDVDARYNRMSRAGRIAWWLPYRTMQNVPGGVLLTTGVNRLMGRTWPR